ncbi:tetratricopeptide repeat protein [Prosthecobacter sp.]|uniref:tetratricopeptide repeat protein n=1 Tax=Prosthecobacter sp. TaxID=1965333 RepID=UPI0037851D2A
MFTLWFTGRPALQWWRSRQAGRFLTSARAEMDKKEWVGAARWIREAFQIAPKDPAVLRAIADFQIRTNAHPSDVVQTLQRLSSTQDAAPADIAKLARAQIDLGSHDAARKTLALLPESLTAETEAYILKMEKRDSEADARLRTALTAGTGEEKNTLKLAVLDLKQPQPEINQRGRNSLWKMAREDGANTADAISILAADPSLSAQESDRLLEIVHASRQAACRELRYPVLTALLRLRSDQRDALLDRETQAVASADQAQRIAFAHWLSALNEHRRLLAFLPPDLKWKDMPADMARLKLEALAQAEQWSALRTAFDRDRDLEKVLGAVSFNLWQARVASAMAEGAALVQQHLNLAFDATARGQDTAAAVQVAETAEKLGVLNLATAFYQATAALASSPQGRITLLERAYALHLAARDTYALLQVAVEIAKLTPGNQANSFRADYLALLVGESIELVASRMNETQESSDTEYAARLLLLKAMAAHRLHAPIQETGMLKKLQILPWPPGHRAVLAAMLTTSGDESAGFQLAEKIPMALLLPEEKKFLAMAR